MYGLVTMPCYYAPMILTYNFVNVFLVSESMFILMSYDWNSQPEFGLSWNYEIKPSILGIPNLRKITSKSI